MSQETTPAEALVGELAMEQFVPDHDSVVDTEAKLVVWSSNQLIQWNRQEAIDTADKAFKIAPAALPKRIAQIGDFGRAERRALKDDVRKEPADLPLSLDDAECKCINAASCSTSIRHKVDR